MGGTGENPYGHYEDDKMIGFVQEVDKSKDTVVVDISEWEKRDRKGSVLTDEGYSYIAEMTDETVIELENGSNAILDNVKEGQKVLVNPPVGKEFEGRAQEVILLDMTHEEKYSGLLSHTDGLNIVVMYEEGEPISIDIENIMQNIEHKTVGRQMPYPNDFVVDYKSELDFEELPIILVFNREELVFKTHNVDELYNFMETLDSR